MWMVVRDQVATQLVRDAYRFIEDVQVGRRDDFEVGYSETFTKAFELLLPPGYPEGEQVFRGRDGLKRWIEWRMEPERFLPAGDRVVVLIHILARGHLSGVELDRETAHVWSVADDRVTKCQVYFDRSEALDEVIDA